MANEKYTAYLSWEKVSMLMYKKGLSRKLLIEAAGLSSIETLKKIQAGGKIRKFSAIKIAKALGVELYELEAE